MGVGVGQVSQEPKMSGYLLPPQAVPVLVARRAALAPEAPLRALGRLFLHPPRAVAVLRLPVTCGREYESAGERAGCGRVAGVPRGARQHEESFFGLHFFSFFFPNACADASASATRSSRASLLLMPAQIG